MTTDTDVAREVIAEAETVLAAAVNGAETLRAGLEWLQRFVSWPSDHDALLAAVWALGTHCTDTKLVMVHPAYPRLIFTGEKASGKTFAMEQVLSLCPRADIASSASAPSIAEQIAKEHSTIGLDELDLVIGDGAAAKDLRNVMNSGYKVSGAYRRAKVRLPVFAPMALAGLASVLRGNPCLDTLRSRSIIIDMRPAQPGMVDKFRSRLHAAGAEAIREAFASWGEINAAAVAEAWPEIPDGLANRDEEIAAPLLAIGEVIGGEFPDRIRDAVCASMLGRTDAEPTVTPAERLLADISAVWTGAQVGSADLVRRLAGIKGSPWRAIFPDAARAGIELAHYLAPHDITPVKVWLPDEQRSAQGYKRAQFGALLDNAPEGPEGIQADDLQSSGPSGPSGPSECAS
jgi:hypothetical protein